MPKKSLFIAVAVSLAGLSVAGILYGRYRGREAAAAGWLGREAAAVFWLRKLVSAQVMLKSDGSIDMDRDGIGEYGTIPDLIDQLGMRRWTIPLHIRHPEAADYSGQGEAVHLSNQDSPLDGMPGDVDAAGIATHGGYHYRVFLPDNGTPAGWTHGIGPSHAAGFAGGTGKVGIDRAERYWSAIAWPVTRGESGDRAYYVDELGEILESENIVARWSGLLHAPTPDCVRPKSGVGNPPPREARVGRDGDLWTPWDPARLSTRLKEPRKR